MPFCRPSCPFQAIGISIGQCSTQRSHRRFRRASPWATTASSDRHSQRTRAPWTTSPTPSWWASVGRGSHIRPSNGQLASPVRGPCSPHPWPSPTYQRSTKPRAAIITALNLPADIACIGVAPLRLPFGRNRNCNWPPGEIGAKMARTSARARTRSAFEMRLCRRRALTLIDAILTCFVVAGLSSTSI